MNSASELKPILCLVGPTGAGKTQVALEIAGTLGCEIVTCDAMQVYRGMDIGTAKPSQQQQAQIPHHCMDLVDVWQEFSAPDYQVDARAAVDSIQSRDRRPLVVGGTGLYLRALIDDIEFRGAPSPSRRRELEAKPLEELVGWLEMHAPARASKVDLANERRVLRQVELTLDVGPLPETDLGWHQRLSRYPAKIAVLAPQSREELYARINSRVDSMLASGWLDEVAQLLSTCDLWSKTAGNAIGYRQLISVIRGELAIEQAADEIKAKTRTYARRQLTWWRREPRARWFLGSPQEMSNDIAKWFQED